MSLFKLILNRLDWFSAKGDGLPQLFCGFFFRLGKQTIQFDRNLMAHQACQCSEDHLAIIHALAVDSEGEMRAIPQIF